MPATTRRKVLLVAFLFAALAVALWFARRQPAPPAPIPVQNTASKYENKLVRRAGSSPEDQKVYVVLEGKKRWVINRDWITQHGYKWPDDVMFIPAPELEAMPAGEAIQ